MALLVNSKTDIAEKLSAHKEYSTLMTSLPHLDDDTTNVVLGHQKDYRDIGKIITIVDDLTFLNHIHSFLSFSHNLNKKILIIFPTENEWDNFINPLSIRDSLSIEYIQKRFFSREIKNFPRELGFKIIFLERRFQTDQSKNFKDTFFLKEDKSWSDLDDFWGLEEQRVTKLLLSDTARRPNLSEILKDEEKHKKPPLEVLAPIKPMQAASLLMSLNGVDDIYVSLNDKKYKLVSGAEKKFITQKISLPEKNVTNITEIWEKKILLWEENQRELIELK